VRTLIAFVVALVVATAAAGAAGGAERAIPSAGRVVARIPVAGAPLGLLTEPGAVWVTGHHSNFVYRIDPSTDRIAAKVDVIGAWSAQPGRLLGVGGKVIAASYSGRRVAVVDPARNRVVRTFSTPFEICCWPAYGAGSLWLLGYSSPSAANPDRLMRVDLATGRTSRTKALPNAQGLVYGAGSVWASSNGNVVRIDPGTMRATARVRVDGIPLAFGFGSVWVLTDDVVTGVSNVIRIDGRTNRILATVRLPGEGSTLTAARSGVWVTQGPGDSPGRFLWKLDPGSNTVVEKVLLGPPSALDDVAVAADGSIWVTEFDRDLVIRIDAR
jgi:DNA-binding beta-propeller fold protein YncE